MLKPWFSGESVEMSGVVVMMSALKFNYFKLQIKLTQNYLMNIVTFFATFQGMQKICCNCHFVFLIATSGIVLKCVIFLWMEKKSSQVTRATEKMSKKKCLRKFVYVFNGKNIRKAQRVSNVNENKIMKGKNHWQCLNKSERKNVRVTLICLLLFLLIN